MTVQESPPATARGTDPAPIIPRQRHGMRWGQFEKFALVIAWLIVIIAFSVALPATYPTVGNLQAVLGSQAVLLILALGLLFPLTAGEFDLSSASVLSLTSMTVAVLNTQADVNVWVAVGIALVMGLGVGIINGLLVVFARLDSFIATLGTSTIMLGAVYWMSNSTSVTGVDSSLSFLTVGFRGILGLPLQFYYALIATIVIAVILTWTPVGRRLLFVGLGRNVAELTGLSVGRLRIGAFAASGFVAGIAGVIYAGVLGGSDPTSGQSFLLPAFAACFLGATAIVPGRFNAVGTFVAVYFLAAGVVGLQMLGAKNFVQQLFYGGALIVAVTLSQLIRRSGANPKRKKKATTIEPAKVGS